MPFSLEDQLKLFDPRRFEELCAQLIKQETDAATHVEGKGGDEGVDIFSGILDQTKRSEAGSKLNVWQVKFFRDGLKYKQRQQAEKSLQRVLSQHHPDSWTLCFPVNLDIDGARWFEELQSRYPEVTLEKWGADEIVRRINNDSNLAANYFLLPHGPISNEAIQPILDRLDGFESVAELVDRLGQRTKTPLEFYNGTIPDWLDILHNFDAPREQIGALWHFASEHSAHSGGRVPLALVTGRSGDGKSTLLMRFAIELVNQGQQLVFYCKDDAESLRADQFFNLPEGATAFVLVDRITRFDGDDIQNFFGRLHRDAIPVVVIAAAVRSIWDGLGLPLQNVANDQEIGLDNITDNDIEALLDKLSEDPTHADEHLGALANLTRDQQAALFKQKAGRQLVVALLEAKHNTAFEAYIRGELRDLERTFQGGAIRRAARYVSALHRLDIYMPVDLLRNLLPDADLEHQVLQRTHGLLVQLATHGNFVITRHATVAEVIFGEETSPERAYEEIIGNAEPDDQRFVGQILRDLASRGDHAVVESLWPKVYSRFPDNHVLLHMRAMFEYRRGNFGDLNTEYTARWLFKKAAEVDPRHVQTWQAWAVMEGQAGRDVGSIDIEYTARWLFKKAAEVDPQHVHVWQAWAVMEGQAGRNVGSIDTEYTARWLFKKAAEVDPQHVHVWQAWAVMEGQAGRNIGSIDIEYSARWLFKRASDVEPQNGTVWQAWAGMEAKIWNFGRIEDAYTARWLLKKATDAVPDDAMTWTQWADLEKSQKQLVRAVELLSRAAQVERNPGSRARIYFDAAVCSARANERDDEIKFLKLAILSNTNDSIAQARLGKAFGFQKRWTESERHFQISLSLRRDDSITRNDYEQMRRARYRDIGTANGENTKPQGN